MSGWGSTPWGAGPWGAGTGDELRLIEALAIRENVVRLRFSQAPVFTGILDPNDASDPARFQFVAQAEPLGRDGLPARAVLPVQAQRAVVPGGLGAYLDVTVDRPLSPWPARYRVTCNQLITYDGAYLDPAHSSLLFPGVYRELFVPNLGAAAPSRDIANPQTYLSQLDPIPQAGDAKLLGVFPVTSTGGYAKDEGLAQLRKRIFRRLLTRRGAFLSLPAYGVGVPSYGKRLGQAGVRQQIAAEAQLQISQEPDVASVSVTVVGDPSNPSITLVRIRVKQAGSGREDTFNVPFQS